jgi:hypothetical protein
LRPSADDLPVTEEWITNSPLPRRSPLRRFAGRRVTDSLQHEWNKLNPLYEFEKWLKL